MAEVRGKFITLACDLIKSKPEARQQAIDSVKRLTGKDLYELGPEDWFDTKVVQAVFDAIETNTQGIMGWASIKVIGKHIYPLIKSTVGLPPHLKTSLDFIKLEADGFMRDHRGPDVVPRKFIKADDGEVIGEASAHGYDCALIEDVFEGILISVTWETDEQNRSSA